jgi:geranylgeranyl pyrophosphate synthase
MRDFNTEYKKIYELVSDDVERVKKVVFAEFPDNNPVLERLAEYFSTPSKHIRAVLSFLYLRSLDISIDDKQILFQTVIELIHNASLIHDDVIDDSKVRRGYLSLNYSEGNHLAVILGDYVISKALKLLCKLHNAEIFELFSNTMSDMCLGEIIQQNSLYKIPSLEEYIDKTYKKTGALFNMAIAGAINISGCQGYRVSNFAKSFGIAFQLRDDIKNVVENSVNGDIKNGIYAAPVIFGGSVEKYSSGIEKAVGLSDNYIQNAVSELKNIKDNKYKAALIELTELLKYE